MNERQKRFAAEFLLDLNATRAAIRAGYSEKTARAIGCENLAKPHIADEISRLMQKRIAGLELDADTVLNGLADIARNEDNNASVRVRAYELLGRYFGLWDGRFDVQAEGQNCGVIVFVKDDETEN